MDVFQLPLLELHEIEKLREEEKKEQGIYQLSGCMDTNKAHLIHGITEAQKNILVVTFSEQRAKELREELRLFRKEVVEYPAKDILFYQSDIHGSALTKERVQALQSICEEDATVLVTTFDALMNKLPGKSAFTKGIQKLKIGETLQITNWEKQLVSLGYTRNYQVENPGEFAGRGGIIDIFPFTEENPIRIELWGDEIDSLRSFDLETQRSIQNLEEIEIYPAGEFVLSEESKQKGLQKIRKDAEKQREVFRKNMQTEEAHHIKTSVEMMLEEVEELGMSANLDFYLPYFIEEVVSLLDYFDPKNTIVFLDELARVAEKGRTVELEFTESMKQRLEKGYLLPAQLKLLYREKEIFAKLQKYFCVALSTLDLKVKGVEPKAHLQIQSRGINVYNNSFETLLKDLNRYKKQKYRVVLLSASRTKAKHLAEDLQREGLNAFYTEDETHELKPSEIMIMYGKSKGGFEYPQIKFVVMTESDIFGGEKKKKKRKRLYEGEKIRDFTDLSVGDYVVHESHGLGIYRGIEKVEVDHNVRDYMKVEYAGGGNLYVLATQLDKIQKYTGADARKPKLNKLGGQEWNKTKSRVHKAVREVAAELVQLYAVRQEKQGYVYGPDTVWQREFEELFPYEETEDQELAIAATKQDMESTKIMDRLICGDVGFGKTEVAIRAAFKAVQDSKQVAFLVPTTILAQQHYNNFVQRMKDFPIRVELLSRFRSPAEQKKAIADLKKGTVDILIGTHRLLSKDVVFKDLGLLIIDEEQRFGVTHKEKIKQMKNNVDVLTLTATPIPRTLHMSLIGIRDMSLLEEAPNDRQPIQTYVMEYNEEMVREAISRELSRNGQVFYVFNRVKQIAEMTAYIQGLVPEATVEFAHGQMKERELEDIMYRFINGEIDVLVSTTIIETGMDIANVNTMIIHDADNMGLSQLYQLRGRVGRSNRTAYAFFLYRRDKLLKEVAEKRLAAIKEYTELGSGFRIAMRDLEIRGAGNLLGEEQHGHMAAVGYDLYCKMLNEAVKEEKGLKTEESFDTTFDMIVDAYIPESYILNEYQKMDIYKRIAAIESEEDAEEMIEELIDRFGEPGQSVLNLIRIAKLRAKAHSAYFTDVVQTGGEMKFVFFERAKIDAAKLPEFIKGYEGALTFRPEKSAPTFYYALSYNTRTKKQDLLTFVEEFINRVQQELVEKSS